MKKPTPDDVYEAFIDAGWNGAYADVYGFISKIPNYKNKEHICVLSDLYFTIKKKFRFYKVEEFHEMLVGMYRNWQDWHGYIVNLQRGIITGVMTEKAKERKIIPDQGWKFIGISKVK